MSKHLPEVLETFRETDDVLDHVSYEVSHMWESGENTFSVWVAIYVLLFVKGTGETGGGGGGGGGRLAWGLVVLTHTMDVSVHRLKPHPHPKISDR